jgi:hypothetical protein
MVFRGKKKFQATGGLDIAELQAIVFHRENTFSQFFLNTGVPNLKGSHGLTPINFAKVPSILIHWPFKVGLYVSGAGRRPEQERA